MENTRAVRIHQYGGPEVLRFEDVRRPLPDPDQVLIHVHAAGVNPIDWKMRAGHLHQTIPISLPFTLGSDLSGTVVAVGADVTEFRPGVEVYGQAAVFHGGSGSFAEYAIAQADSIALKPRCLNHDEAGAMPLIGVSALQALTQHLHILSNQKILIQGGAGGIGSMAIQLARHFGAHVATTVSGSDVDFVKALGANEIVDYGKEEFEEVFRDFDAVLDTVGGDTYVRSFQTLKRGGRIVSMVERPNQELMTKFGVQAFAQFTQVTTERLTALITLVDEGALEVFVGQTFPLADAAWALLFLERGALKGKVVLQVM